MMKVAGGLTAALSMNPAPAIAESSTDHSDASNKPIVRPNCSLPKNAIVRPNCSLPKYPIVKPNCSLPKNAIVRPNCSLPKHAIVRPNCSVPKKPKGTPP